MTARLPIVAVPTTYAGSEITPIWGLTEDGRKTTGVDPAVLPRVVVYDPTLTATLPPDLAAASGFNALAHAVEAMWAPRRNPVSTAVAGRGRRAAGDRAALRRPGGAAVRGVAGLVRVRGGRVGAAPQALPRARRHVRAAARPHARRRAAARGGVQRARCAGSGRAGGPGARRRRRGRRAARPRRRARHPAGAAGARDAGERDREAAALTAPAVPADNPVPVADGAMLRLVPAAWSGSDDALTTKARRHENGDSPLEIGDSPSRERGLAVLRSATRRRENGDWPVGKVRRAPISGRHRAASGRRLSAAQEGFERHDVGERVGRGGRGAARDEVGELAARRARCASARPRSPQSSAAANTPVGTTTACR